MKKILYDLIANSGIWLMYKLFPEYFAAEPLEPTDRYLEYPWAIDNLYPFSGKILDIGCAGSMFPLILTSLGYETYGIDIREYKPSNIINFTKGDICNSPFKDGEFDVITAISSIEHIGLGGRYGSKNDENGDYQAMKEIRRILKPYGKLLMTVPFSKRLKITKSHRVYNNDSLNRLLEGFNPEIITVQSPEADYKIVLIKATKNG